MSSTKSRRMKHETAREDMSGVRVRGACAGLQGRSHAGPVSHRARQDLAEPAIGDVRAAPAPARDRHQAGAPVGPATLHQGVRRLKHWRFAAGVLVFAAVAPLSFVALPFATLLALARPRSRREWLALGSAGGAALALLAAPGQGSLDALTRGWIVLVTVAFAAGAKLSPPPPRFWPLALRACLYAAVGLLLLVNVRAATGAMAAAVGTEVGGGGGGGGRGGGGAPVVWTEVQWEATRGASRAVRYVVELAPVLYPA